ncbi:ATP-binding cassette domain-containing protein [Iamia majanohamensis]|uniref:ATP-binding cassette domain-containing protein n=1 Tax=Iamia majanohamensis TaxID=467976 RepID=A0AAE9Y4V0_9ACTN|nr:ATP-binding cassette domain-containing protein [Iamia majanohamensis]WCO65236.1 ATP-binding cassette domain-containing protein [Iamia majanohamensis]
MTAPHPGEVRWHDVGFAYPEGPPVLDGVDLVVADGEVVLVVGGSGSGKSTLLRTVNGLVPHTTGGRFRGAVGVGPLDVTGLRPRDLAGAVGFVHQDPEAQVVVDEVEHDVAFVLENLGLPEADMRRRVEEVLDAVGIAALRHRSPSTLSGGERQRCAVAGALAAAPAVLVLDEPTSMLDPQGADDVLAAVARLADDLGTTVVMAEHRLERAAPLADRAVVLADGRVAADGAPGPVLAGDPGAPPVAHLGRLLGWDPPPLTVREARRRARTTPVALSPSPVPDPPAPGEPLVVARGLAAGHGGRTPVLRGVDLTLHRGEVVALVGRNGSGKSTLLRTLADLAAPEAGTVDRRGRVALVPQDPSSLLFSPTVRDEVAETCRLVGRDADEVEPWLARLALTDLADRHPRSLSTGERQRVAVAAVAVGGAPVLLLDEPTRGIDATSRAALEAAATAHAAGGGAVVIATHDVELAARTATRVVSLGGGEVVADGPARQVLSGSLFAPQVLRVLPPHLTVAEVAAALPTRTGGPR